MILVLSVGLLLRMILVLTKSLLDYTATESRQCTKWRQFLWFFTSMYNVVEIVLPALPASIPIIWASNNAIADCNGDLLENGSIVVYPDPAATCPVVVQYPDGTGAYFSFRDLAPGDYSGLEISLDGGYTYETLPTMTVGFGLYDWRRRNFVELQCNK